MRTEVEPEIIDIQVRWMQGWANHPTLEVLLNRVAENDEFVFKEIDGHYYAMVGAEVMFYYYVKPGDGFAGRVFHIKLDDGTEKDLKGPWSSSSSSMDKYFPPCIDCGITDDPEVMERGYTFYAGHVSVEAVQEWLAEHGEDLEWELVEIDFYGSTIRIPKLKAFDNPCHTCKGFGKHSIFSNEGPHICKHCKGTGIETDEEHLMHEATTREGPDLPECSSDQMHIILS